MRMDLRNIIDRYLDKYLPRQSEEPKIIHKAMRYSVFSGGKRLRPILVIESSRACGGRLKDALPVACAVELVHTYSLIHDDLPSMDNDDYRRGKLSCHKKFGEANAILVGDALLTLAFNIISKRGDPKVAVGAISQLSESIGTKGMVGGQAIDIEFKNRDKNKNILQNINHLKTSKLFETSAKLGGIAAGATKKELNAIGMYGASLGMAFQIVDDIIDGEDYVKLFGMDKARRDSEALLRRAKDALKIFGKKAERLEEIVNEASYRKNR